MAKKLNCRQLREENERKKREKFREEENKRIQEKIEAEETEIKEKKEREILAKIRSKPIESKITKKSYVKAAGVKSVFAANNAVYMTSFGKGNDAVPEKKIASGKCESLNTEKPAFKITDISEICYKISSEKVKNLDATADSPIHHKDNTSSKIPTDMLCLKTKLEEKFYDKQFTDDNIHIQLIYNVLDIEKIIAEYSTNAVYAIDNLFRNENEESDDFIGGFSTSYPYENLEGNSDRQRDKCEKFNNLISNRRLGYFAEAFYTYKTDKKNKNKKTTCLRNRKECYNILALIGSLRQWSFHGEDKFDSAWLYNLDSKLGQDYKDILDDLYNKAVSNLSGDFVSTNKVNIQILGEIFKEEKLSDLANEYYDFLITKKQKNIGFSIKKLREIMLEGTEIKNTKYDSVRSKLYKLIDFIIWHGYIHEDVEEADKLVNELRSTLDNETKEKVYYYEADRLWKKNSNIILGNIVDSVNEKNINTLQKNQLDNVTISDDRHLKSADKVHYFTKLIYLVTLFIDGKEINDLLTTLIHKFDNIRSINDTMKSIGLDTKLVDDYSFFDNSDVIFSELTELNSFVRMSTVDSKAKNIMYRDALDILGIDTDMSEEKLDTVINRILCLDANGKPINDKKNKNSGLRNFIANNVISSTRFRYLIRYGNSMKIRKLADCDVAVKFVLKDIPDEQIDRYYSSCRDPFEKPALYPDEKREYLAKQIKEMSFEKIEDAGTVQKANTEKSGHDSEKKRRYQAVVRLYLTVMYLMLKNLVNVNSRYVQGFHCLERDSMLYANLKLKNDYRKLTFMLMGISEDSIHSGKLEGECDTNKAKKAGNRYLENEYWYKIIFDNLKKSDIATTKTFRNAVAHLNAIRNIDENIMEIDSINNYFGLYHYIIQRHIQKKLSVNSDYFKLLDNYKTYSKDFVKAYCTPMAYNLVRYKNLTIDGLFDKNYMRCSNSNTQ